VPEGRGARRSAIGREPLRVECYAGARADETPRRFWSEGQPIEVVEVLDRAHEVRSQPGWPRADHFTVRGADQREYRLTHDLESDDWFLDQGPTPVRDRQEPPARMP
jgi:hypothetical protein